MFSAILILLALPFTDLSRSRGIQFRPLSKIAFFIFVGNFLVLLQLGAKHVVRNLIIYTLDSTLLRVQIISNICKASYLSSA